MIVLHPRNLLLPIGILLISAPINPKAQLTFLHNGGRLGDVYLNALLHTYLAQKYDLDLRINTNIPYLHHFTIGTMHNIRELHKKKKIIKREHDLISIKDKVLYISSLSTSINSLDSDYPTALFKLYVENDTFRQQVKRHLSLRGLFGNSKVTHDAPSVAVHIRKGSGPDGPLQSPQYRYISDFHYPLKFPPEQYYVDQIILLKQLIHPEQLYVRIFTDDKKPHELVDRIRQKAGIQDIFFDYHQSNSEIEDIYEMISRDFLIRSGSHFSLVAQFLGKHKAIISPTRYQWEGNYLHITESTIFIPDYERHTLHAIRASHENGEQIRSMLEVTKTS